MVELPINIESQIENVWLNYQKKLVTKKNDEIAELIAGGCGIEELINKVEDFNSIVDGVVGNDEELYDKYRFRMFVKNMDVVLLRDPVVISEKDRMFQIEQDFYNLSDFDEIGVDVRRRTKDWGGEEK